METLETLKFKTFKRDELVNFFCQQNKKIENYNFDLFHDITKIVNYAYNSNNYRDEFGQIITDKAVTKTFYFYVRKLGTYLWTEDQISEIRHTESTCDYINKYKIEITPNCDYLYNVDFCKITNL